MKEHSAPDSHKSEVLNNNWNGNSLLDFFKKSQTSDEREGLERKNKTQVNNERIEIQISHRVSDSV